MEDNKCFKIVLKENWFTPNQLIQTFKGEAKVIETPKRKWYCLLLQYLTLGFYRAGWYYKIEIIENGFSINK